MNRIPKYRYRYNCYQTSVGFRPDMSQADGLSLEVGDQVSDLALHEALPGQLVLLTAATRLQHDKVTIFTEKVRRLK